MLFLLYNSALNSHDLVQKIHSLGDLLLKLQVGLFWKNKGLFPQLQLPFALRNGQAKSMRQVFSSFFFSPNSRSDSSPLQSTLNTI